MTAESELTIVVRVKDAASRVLDGMKRTIGRALSLPFRQLAKDVGDVLKRLVSVKTYAGLAAAAFATLVAGAKSLAKHAKDFEPAFSRETQERIDAVATAINKVAASIKAMVGHVVAELEPEMTAFFNGISSWLRDNKDDVVKTVRQVADEAKRLANELATAARNAAELLQKLNHPIDAMFGGAGSGELPWEMRFGTGGPGSFDPATVQRYLDANRRPGVAITDRTNLGGPKFGGGFPESRPTSRPESRPESQPSPTRFPAIGSTEYAQAMFQTAAANDAARASAEKLKQSIAPTPELVRDVSAAAEEAATSIGSFGDELTESERAAARLASQLDQDLIPGFLKVGDVAESASARITDGFFDVINGAQRVGAAIRSMVASILEDLGRLLIQRALLSAFGGLLGSAGGGGFSSGESPGLPSGAVPVGGLRGGFASGGPVRRGGMVRVGEQGPEDVVLPQGAYVHPAHRSRGGGADGGVTIVINGARDPVATGREVERALGRSRALRARVRGVLA